MLALGVITYLLAAALPRVEEKEVVKINFLERLARSEIPEKIDLALNKYLEKLLRRAKVLTLKMDNGINSFLGRVKIKEEKEEKDLAHLIKTPENSESKTES